MIDDLAWRWRPVQQQRVQRPHQRLRASRAGPSVGVLIFQHARSIARLGVSWSARCRRRRSTPSGERADSGPRSFFQCRGWRRVSLYLPAGVRSKACAYGDFDALVGFVTADKDCVNRCDEGGYYPLQWAALNNRVAEASYLLEQGAAINAVDHTGELPGYVQAVCRLGSTSWGSRLGSLGAGPNPCGHACAQVKPRCTGLPSGAPSHASRLCCAMGRTVSSATTAATPCATWRLSTGRQQCCITSA